MSRRPDGDVLRDRLCPPAGPWREIEVLDEVDSTNAYASAHARPWTVVVADHQTGGRGRHGRPWSSPPGTSVALSFVVPAPAGPERAWLPLVAGLAVGDAFAALLRRDDDAVELKWPNDVLVTEAEAGRRGEAGAERADEAGAERGGEAGTEGREARKVCGILCQVLPGDLAVVGIGVNVTLDRAALPVPTASSLHLCAAGTPPTREEVVAAIAEAFARRHRAWVDDPAGQRRAYRAACATIGREVDVHLPQGRIVRGLAVDVDDDGCLVVEIDGDTRVFAAGDVVHLRRARESLARGKIGS